MPSRPNVARTKTIRKRERRELPAMYRNPRAGTWRDPATPSERSITCGAPVKLDAHGRRGLHRSDSLWGRGWAGPSPSRDMERPKRDRGKPSLTKENIAPAEFETTEIAAVAVWGRASGPSNGAGLR